MATVELQYGGTKASIDLKGAWVTRLSDERGDILYPREIIWGTDNKPRVRGGMHVCVPNFGPGGETDQPQHGFGRQSEWRLVGDSGEYASMILLSGDGQYKDLSCMLSFDIEEHGLTATLSLINRGKTPLRVAPGFHPYFALGSSRDVTLNDEPLDVTTMNETAFIGGESHDIEVDGRLVTIESNELTRWALWTDLLDEYVCIEPTLSGYAFTRTDVPKEELLQPEEQHTYTVSITW